MSELIVVGFDDPHMADEALLKLNKLQSDHLVGLEDAAVVRRDKQGKVQIWQGRPLVAYGALDGGVSGGLWGMLFGLLFSSPLLGWAVGSLAGAGAGAAAGALTDVGISDDLIKEIGYTIQPHSSALFVLIGSTTPDKVLPELKDFEGTLLRTSLSEDADARLRAALTDQPQPEEFRSERKALRWSQTPKRRTRGPNCRATGCKEAHRWRGFWRAGAWGPTCVTSASTASCPGHIGTRQKRSPRS